MMEYSSTMKKRLALNLKKTYYMVPREIFSDNDKDGYS